jgi:hypothetical protein
LNYVKSNFINHKGYSLSLMNFFWRNSPVQEGIAPYNPAGIKASSKVPYLSPPLSRVPPSEKKDFCPGWTEVISLTPKRRSAYGGLHRLLIFLKEIIKSIKASPKASKFSPPLFWVPTPEKKDFCPVDRSH